MKNPPVFPFEKGEYRGIYRHIVPHPKPAADRHARPYLAEGYFSSTILRVCKKSPAFIL
jgi:hypothetical protein